MPRVYPDACGEPLGYQMKRINRDTKAAVTYAPVEASSEAIMNAARIPAHRIRLFRVQGLSPRMRRNPSVSTTR